MLIFVFGERKRVDSDGGSYAGARLTEALLSPTRQLPRVLTSSWKRRKEE